MDAEELRRIESALDDADRDDLRRALAEGELRFYESDGDRSLWRRIERRVRSVLTAAPTRRSDV